MYFLIQDVMFPKWISRICCGQQGLAASQSQWPASLNFLEPPSFSTKVFGCLEPHICPHSMVYFLHFLSAFISSWLWVHSPGTNEVQLLFLKAHIYLHIFAMVANLPHYNHLDTLKSGSWTCSYAQELVFSSHGACKQAVTLGGTHRVVQVSSGARTPTTWSPAVIQEVRGSGPRWSWGVSSTSRRGCLA